MTDLPLHLRLGSTAERIALGRFIRQARARGRRARLLQANYRCRAGEVDLVLEEVAEDAGVELVFVEVRARRSRVIAPAVESVDWSKRKKLARTIRHFLAYYRGPARTLRVDLMTWSEGEWGHLRDIRLED